MDTQNNETVQEFNATIIKVMTPQGADDRITFVFDRTFETIDKNTGEIKESNMFGLNIYNVVQQVAAKVPEIQLADTLAMGAMVNPQIIALAMINAETKIKREYHEAGEAREATNDTYTANCWVSKFEDVRTHIAPVFASMLQNLIMTKPAIIKTAAVPNPFGIN